MIWAKSSWNGHHDRACEALGRIASWAKDATVLNDPAMEARAKRLLARCTELQAYIETNEGALIDYGQRKCSTPLRSDVFGAVPEVA